MGPLTSASVSLVLASLAVLATGCATGPVTTLASTRPADIQIRLGANGTAGLCPGFSDDLIVEVTDTDGMRHATTGPGGGKLLWPNFDIALQGGVVDLRGRIRLIPYAELLAFKPPVIQITPIHWPKRSVERPVPLRFDCHFKAHFGGRGGRRGSIGGKGLVVTATATMLVTPKGKLIRIVLVSADGARGGSFLLQPGKGRLTISARGGVGADEDAERGHKAAVGGDGGTITFTVDPAAKPYVSQVDFDVGGGKGGLAKDGSRQSAGRSGPPPKVVHAPVFEPL